MQGNPFDRFDGHADEQADPIARKFDATTRGAEATADKTEAELPFAADNASAQARLHRANADAAEAKNAAQPSADEVKAKTALAKFSDVEDKVGLLNKLQEARGQVGFWSTGIPGQVTNGLWGAPSTDLSSTLSSIDADKVISTLGGLKAQSRTGASGFGALSEKELALLKAKVTSLAQSQSPEQLQKHINELDVYYRRLIAKQAGMDPDTPEGKHWAGLYSADTAADVPPGGKLANGTERVADPARAGLDAAIRDMVKAGRSPDQIRAFLDSVQPGLGAAAKGVEDAVMWERAGNSVRYGKPTIDIEHYDKPKEGFDKTLGDAANSDLGAYFIGAGDVASAGFMDNMAENPTLARAAIGASQEEHPKSFLAGQLATGVLGGSAADALAARYGLPVLAGRSGDMLMGSAYGMGSEDDGNRLWGGVKGAGASFLGSTAGGAVARGGGTIMRGVQDEAAQLLDRYNVRMTPGQLLGGAWKRNEDKAMSWPIVGGSIREGRNQSVEDFNRAAFDEALAPLGISTEGQIGHQGVALGQEAVDNAYRQSLGGLTLQADPQFVRAVRGNLRHRIASIPREGQALAQQVDDIIDTYMGSGRATGEDFQAMLRELRELRTAPATKQLAQYGSRIAPRLIDVENELTDLVRRQAPDRLDLFQRANEAYNRMSIVGDAVLNSGGQQNGIFNPAKLTQYARSSGVRFQGRNAARRGDIPFLELGRAGGTTLPSGLANSGTVDRAMFAGLVGTGVGAGNYFASGDEKGEHRNGGGSAAMALATMAALGIPYSRASQRMWQRVLGSHQRPQDLRTIGDLVYRYSNIPGHAGAVANTRKSKEDRIPNPDVPNNDPAFERARNSKGITLPMPADVADSGHITLAPNEEYDPQSDEVINIETGERRPAGE